MTFEISDRLDRVIGARRAAFAACVLLLFAIQYTSWICDDALITLRSVVNFVAGDGISWHAGERTQVFTHPLWFLLLSTGHALGLEVVAAAVFGGLGLSAVALGILFFGSGRASVWSAVAAGLMLVGSRGYVDYSTSGLENSLSGLLLVLLLARIRSRDSHRFVPICAGLLLLNRLDALFLLLPLLWWWQRRGPARRRRELVIFGAGPAVLWMLFSTFYFGAPLPNPYFAKLHAGLPRLDHLRRGAAYFASSALYDPSTALALILAVFAGLHMRGLAASVGVGILLQCGYVLWVGGDFMLSRYFYLPVVASAAAILLTPEFGDSIRQFRALALLALLACAAPAVVAHLDRPGRQESQEQWQEGGRGGRMHWGVADERRWYAFEYGLYSPHRRWPRLRRNGEAALSEVRVIEGGAGLLGIAGTDRVRLLDRTGLVDPFLARLPAERDPMWRIGHAFRALPPGYVDSRLSGENQIADPVLARLYERLDLVARAPLLDAARLRAVAALLPATFVGPRRGGS
ncbi:MAG TPA: hypothetical protein VGB13_05045 [Candidatus Krumholzibacteria bacterium]|jgi:arabinofuranosyltransferase